MGSTHSSHAAGRLHNRPASPPAPPSPPLAPLSLSDSSLKLANTVHFQRLLKPKSFHLDRNGHDASKANHKNNLPQQQIVGKTTTLSPPPNTKFNASDGHHHCNQNHHHHHHHLKINTFEKHNANFKSILSEKQLKLAKSFNLLSETKQAAKSCLSHVGGGGGDSKQTNHRKVTITENGRHSSMVSPNDDGDVFIYPPTYRDQNECHKCSRDNKICNCNNIETSSHEGEEEEEKEANNEGTNNDIKRDSVLNDTHINSNTKNGSKSVNTNGSATITSSPTTTVATKQATSESNTEQASPLKSVYKISIATGLIDQKNNQLLFSTPKIVNSSVGVAGGQLSPTCPPVPPRAQRDPPVSPYNHHSNGSQSASSVNALLSNIAPGDGLTIANAKINSLNETKILSFGIGAPKDDQFQTTTKQQHCNANESSYLQTQTNPNLQYSAHSQPANNQNRSHVLLPVASISNSNIDNLNADSQSTTTIAIATKSTPLKALEAKSSIASSSFKDRKRCNTIDHNNNSCNGMSEESIVLQQTGLEHGNKTGDGVSGKINGLNDALICINADQTTPPSEQEQITCNLSFGDSIKITGTSICIGSSEIPTGTMKSAIIDQSSNTTIVPIQNLSTKRRNLTPKLSRQAIFEDGDEFDRSSPSLPLSPYTTEEQNVVGAILDSKGTATPQGSLVSDIASHHSSTSGQTSNETLEYSPILTGVRDYIENINPELKLQSSVGSSSFIMNPTGPVVETNDIPISNSLLSSSSTIRLSLAPGTQTTSSPIHGASINDGIPQTANFDVVSSTTTPIATGLVVGGTGGTSSLVANRNELNDSDSQKKSIFDGASKDEILEYLEDARERVPEVLIAADDVMVIGDNELIVVNQLEPNAPATPISIVEDNDETINANITGDVASSSESGDHPMNHPEQLRKHLEQMYHNSHIASPCFSSTNDTVDEDTGIDSGGQNSGTNSKLDSNCSSIDPTNPILQRTGSRISQYCSLVKTCSSKTNLSCMGVGSTLDSFDQIAGFDNNGCISIDRVGGVHNSSGQMDDHNQQQGSQIADSRRTVSSPTNQPINMAFFRRSLKPTYSSLSNSSNRSHEEANTNSSRMNYSASYKTRRNSSSGGSGQSDRTCALQMMLLQQRYNNRDSLSSSSSTPPSSTSPSSSISSNQTSGNCSTTSNLYASSSLSCSSPFLALSALNASASPQTTFNNAINNNVPNLLKLDHEPHNIDSSNNKHHHSGDNNAIGSKPIKASTNGSGPEVERDDSGLGSESLLNHHSKNIAQQTQKLAATTTNRTDHVFGVNYDESDLHTNRDDSAFHKSNAKLDQDNNSAMRLSVIEETQQDKDERGSERTPNRLSLCSSSSSAKPTKQQHQSTQQTTGKHSTRPSISSPNSNVISWPLHSHYATMNRFANYLINRSPMNDFTNEANCEFQCLDCDQLIIVDHEKMLHKTNEIRLLRENDVILESIRDKPMTVDQLDRAYIAAMNGLPLCQSCEKKRVERKEIISEFVETELKYGRDLKIIHDEFYRPMQIAGLLNKDQINGIFLNLEELIMAHCRFADRLETAISEAHSMGDTDFNTVNIGKLFVESADMLHTFESYCIRQGSAACLLARLSKEKELLRVFLRVSQMENTLLRRMNLAAFLMVPVQRVTKYPLLLNRLYKVTAYHHKDREALRDAQLKVELHLEHINHQTKGVSATNKIWRRISNLSAPISNRRGLINAEDIGYIKLRKTAMDILKWNRDETQFIHSGKINFAPLNEYLIKHKMKPLRYMASHALLIVLGKPNWKYRPDLVKSNLDSKLMVPTPGGNGIKEAALLLFREKNGRFVPCREPLFLSNCVLSTDCSQFNNECPLNQANHCTKTTSTGANQSHSTNSRKSLSGSVGLVQNQNCNTAPITSILTEFRAASAESSHPLHMSTDLGSISKLHSSKNSDGSESAPNSIHGDSLSMSSLKSLPEDQSITLSSPPIQAPRSYSLASALPRTPIVTVGSNNAVLTKSTSSASSNMTIINQLMTKVNNYHNSHHQKQSSSTSNKTTAQSNAELNHKIANNLQLASIQGATSQTDMNNNNSQQQLASSPFSGSGAQTNRAGKTNHNSATITATNQQQAFVSLMSNNNTNGSNDTTINHHQHYNHHFFHNHHQLYGDYEESFEIHENLTKESLLLRADTPLKTRYWLQMLRYHAKDLGQWRTRRNGLANILLMRQD